MIQPPQHLMRSGVELLAEELEKQARQTADLYAENDRLKAQVQELERILKSYINSPSGTNNLVLP